MLQPCLVFLFPPCCVDYDRRPDLNSKRRQLTSFLFSHFLKVFCFSFFFFFFAARHPALACWNLEWEFGGILTSACESAGRSSVKLRSWARRPQLSPAHRPRITQACRSILSQVCRLFICPARLLWLSQARRTLLSQVCQPFLCPTRRLWLSQARLPLVSQVHGQPLVHARRPPFM